MVNPLVEEAVKDFEDQYCPDCENTGWRCIAAHNVTAVIHGRKPERASVLEIQKCDTCDRLKNDVVAQEEFLKAVVAGKADLPDTLILYGPNYK
jgi:hypothetical protein